MIRNFLITVIGFVSGADIHLRNQVATGARGKLSLVLENLRKQVVLGSARRRQSSAWECYQDVYQDALWCLPDAESTCSTLGDGHTRWVFQVDGDTEYMCIPSSCSANLVEGFWLEFFEKSDSASTYCTLECPEIQFDVHGLSDDGKIVDVSGTYKYADLSYECAGSTAVIELSTCEESTACPSDVTGFKTCRETTKEIIPSDLYPLDKQVKNVVEVCLPDACTDEANLEKLEDFSYATHWYDYADWYDYYGIYNITQFRESISISWSCEVAEGKDDNNNNTLYLIFGLIVGGLVLCFLGALCLLRIRLSKEVTIAEVITGEPDNLDKSETFEPAIPEYELNNTMEIGNREVNAPSDPSLVYQFQTNDGTTRGEVNHQS